MPRGTKKKVLLVDDESDMGLIFKRILEKNNIVVDYHSSPLEALRNFKPNFYDLAILDIKMPQMNGTKLYIELRKLDQKMPVCSISAYEMTISELREILPDYITNCFMKKPIPKETLLTKVQQILCET